MLSEACFSAVTDIDERQHFDKSIMSSSEFAFFIGGFTTKAGIVQGHAEGVYVASVNTKTGIITRIHKKGFDSGENPTFITIAQPDSADGGYLLAVNESDISDGKVTSMKINSDFSLSHIASWIDVNTKGGAYISTALENSKVLVANYASGSIQVFELNPKDGFLKPEYFEQFSGSSGAVPSRQEAPHAHCILADPKSELVLVADLGCDLIRVYRFTSGGKFEPVIIPGQSNNHVVCPPGSGPRHVTYHPTEPWVFVAGELSNTVMVFHISQYQNNLKLIQTISTLPAGFQGTSTTADIHCSSDARFLYISNRGHDSITQFLILPTGRVELMTWFPVIGEIPRNFAITPDGKAMLVANRGSDKIVSFLLDAETGALLPTGHCLYSPTPACIQF